jgi:hypothetical protein
MKTQAALWALTISLAFLDAVPTDASAGAIDDIKIEVSHDHCAGEGGNDTGNIVYATNLNSARTIDATFKYDSNPAQQHFILFDANLNPITDRFPKSASRRMNPRETANIGCTYTYRAAAQGSAILHVPIVVSQQGASYVDATQDEPSPADARSFAAYLLQGSSDCGAGSKPPGRFYLVNLHPFAQLSVSLSLLNARGAPASPLTHALPGFGAIEVGCSNGPAKPGPVVAAAIDIPRGSDAALPQAAEAKPPAPEHPEPPIHDNPAPVTLLLGAVLRTQTVCAGVVPSGWIKVNDAWNPTVCGKPAGVTYNIWMIQQFTDEPIGAVIQACKGIVPAGWAIVATTWNPTVCGHPTTNQQNVVAIKRLN